MNATRRYTLPMAITLVLATASCVTETTRTSGRGAADTAERLEPVKVAEWAKPKPAARKARLSRSDDKAYVGLVRRVPPDGVGLWMVGSQMFESDSFTMLDTFRAPMVPGNCAAVVMSGSRAVRIVFLEPLDC